MLLPVSLFLLLASNVFAITFAFPNCNQNSQFSEIQKFTEKVAIYGDQDHRQTEDAYADSHSLDRQELKAKLSATGKLVCGGYMGTAQLTLKSNLITTAGHMLIDFKNCHKIAEAKQCTFTYRFNDRDTSIPVEKLMATGFNCPNPLLGSEDWAVMKLRSPAVGPIPYSVSRVPPTFFKNQPVTVVANSSLDFCKRNKATQKCERDARTHEIIRPRHVEDCLIRNMDTYRGKLNTLSSDCDVSGGASGGSVLDSDLSDPRLLAINTLVTSDDAQLKLEQKTGNPTKGEYEFYGWETIHVPVVGDFLNAILKASDEDEP